METAVGNASLSGLTLRGGLHVFGKTANKISLDGIKAEGVHVDRDGWIDWLRFADSRERGIGYENYCDFDR